MSNLEMCIIFIQDIERWAKLINKKKQWLTRQMYMKQK